MILHLLPAIQIWGLEYFLKKVHLSSSVFSSGLLLAPSFLKLIPVLMVSQKDLGRQQALGLCRPIKPWMSSTQGQHCVPPSKPYLQQIN